MTANPAEGAVYRFVTIDGRHVDGPREWEPMLLAVDVDVADWERASLRVNDRVLPLQLRRVGAGPCVVAEWPRSGAGRYRLHLHSEAGEYRSQLVIEPAKLSRGEFAHLLDDLQRGLPASVAIALRNAGALEGVTPASWQPSTIAEEVARLRRAVEGEERRPGLVDLLLEIQRAPHVELRRSEQWVQRAHSRMPAVAALYRVVTRPGNATREGEVLQVVDARVVHTTDTYENRIVMTFAQQVQRRLRRLRSVADAIGEESLQKDADALLDRLSRAISAATCLQDVSTLRSAPRASTMVLLRRPAYRVAFERYLEFQRGLTISLDAVALEAPLEQLPTLYQLWATLHIIREFVNAAASAGFRVVEQNLVARGVDGPYVRVLPDGRPAVTLRHLNGTSASLIPERRYVPGAQSSGLYSISFEQRPDIAVEVREVSGAVRIVLFDPKYKLDGSLDDLAGREGSRPTKLDVDRMHAYRDAIRGRSGQRVVEHAGILYPGATMQFGNAISAISARPSVAAVLHQEVAAVLQGVLRSGAAASCAEGA